MKRFAWFAVSAAVLAVGCSSSSSTPDTTTSSTPPAANGSSTTPTATAGFASVQPVFAKCAQCHGGPNPKKGFDLASYAGIMNGSATEGPAVKAGDPDASIVVKAMKGDGVKQMPPGGKLSDEEIQKVADWIKAGAKEN